MKMKKGLSVFIVTIFILLVLISCNNDDDNYSEEYLRYLDERDAYLQDQHWDQVAKTQQAIDYSQMAKEERRISEMVDEYYQSLGNEYEPPEDYYDHPHDYEERDYGQDYDQEYDYDPDLSYDR